MKRWIAVLTLALCCASCTGARAETWVKHVVKGGGFSFHYPKGWKVAEGESAIEISNPAAEEQLLILAMPFDAAKNARELAEGMLALLEKANPGMKASDWNAGGQSVESTITFAVTYTEKGKPFRGHVLALKDKTSAHWFSYTGPADGYSAQRALALLQGLVSTIAAGDRSQPPAEKEAEAPAASTEEQVAPKLEQNARAFLFVLEFALGAPFTSAQEKTILAELRQGWQGKTDAELARYDAYRQYVSAILKAGEKDLKPLRGELEKSVREWLNESDAADPAVQAVRSRLEEKEKILIAGEPPLTEMAATAYSELYAYAELLLKEPEALPEQTRGAVVTEIMGQLRKAWKGFTPTQRKQVAGAAPLWLAMRTVLRYGSAEEQARTRAQLRRFVAPAANETKPSANSARPKASAGSKDGGAAQKEPMSMAAHNAMMEIQRMTFNTYMWSRGFPGWTPMGKMW